MPVEADTSKLEADVEQKVKRTRKPDPIEVPVLTDAEKFEQDFRAAMDEGVKASEDADRAMRGSFTAMSSGSRALQAAMKDLAPPADDAARSLQGVGDKAANAGTKAAGSSGGFNLAAAGMVPMIAGALALAPALAAIPAITTVVVAGAGTMALGFGGVVSALKDYGTQSAATGQSSAQLAQTAFANSVAIRNAEDAITQAKKQAAQAAQTSAQNIYSAEERVASSAYSLQQAEQTLQNAEQTEMDAQKALTQARIDAANKLVDLNNAAADSNIAVQQAQLTLVEAQEKLNAVMGSGLSTDDQKKQAQIDLAKAVQGVKDAQQHQVEAQQSANDANKTGVDGMQQVVSAQKAVTSATQGVASAQHGVASAALGQKDAQTALARAVAAAAQQQRDSAAAIAKAVQNLSDTYEQQRLAAAAAASSGQAAANKFARDMANLSPAAQAFVTQLIGMKGGLKELEATAQSTMLPGFSSLLNSLSGSLPGINTAVGKMGTLIGGLATQFGILFQSPAFRGELSAVFQQGLGFAQKFGDGITQMVQGVTTAVSQAGPIVSGLGDGFKTLLSSGIPEFFQGLVTNASGAGSALNGILTIVSNLLGPIGTLSSAVDAALAPALQVLASPAVQQALMSIATSLGQILLALSPVITMLAQGLAGALQIVAPLLASLAKFIQDNQRWLVPLAKAITIATIAWWGLNAAMAANPIVLIITGITTLVLGLIYAWEHFKGFRDFIKAMWKDIQAGFDLFLGFVKQWWPELLAPFTGGATLIVGHWNDIVNFVKLLPGRLAAAATGLWSWITRMWDNDVAGPISRAFDTVITSVTGLPGRLAKAGGGMWDWIRDTFKTAINTVIGWWDSLSFGIPKVHIPGTNVDVGGGSIGVPQIPYLAVGGMLPSGITAVIGERGWEPLRLPDGTVVVPHANAQQAMASAAAAGSAGGSRVQVELVSSGAEDYFLRFLRHAIRVRGGDVQKVLGVS